MKSSPLRPFLFYPAVALCLWPALVNASQVVSYVQLSAGLHLLLRLPPATVAVAALQAGLTFWAIAAAVLLFRKRQDSYAWLVVLLALAPMLSRLTSRYI
ncbi:MAG TPA: hypothetical protein VFW47_02835 [Phenylobacterium sp.]|nr:hypothetical protein [Phenylobacterium sp.]